MTGFWTKTVHLLAFTVGLMGFSERVSADSGPIVVELYTSQGCSSCPPADAVLEKLSQRRDVLALGLHVDYWDYIGWADVFADPVFSDRQRKYARAAGKSMVYTPQMIISGVTHVVGNKPADVEAAIKNQGNQPSPVHISVKRVEGHYVVEAKSSTKKNMVIQLVHFVPLEKINIERGENAGRQISYANIVSDWSEIKKWDGTSPEKFKIKAGRTPYAVIIQSAGHGRVWAAARLD